MNVNFNEIVSIVAEHPVIFSMSWGRDKVVAEVRQQLVKALRNWEEAHCDVCGAPMRPTDEMCSRCG